MKKKAADPERTVQYFCYMLICDNGAYYTGWTTDPARRFRTHLSGKGAAYTKMHPPQKLVYLEERPSRHEAMLREIELKKYTHLRKEKLCREWCALNAPEEAEPQMEKEEHD